MTTENPGTGAESQTTEAETGSEELQQEVQQEQQAEGGEKKPEPTEKTDTPTKVVPLAALHEERAARKELQKQLAEQRQMMEKVNGRLEVLFNPPKEAPQREQDPVGYIDHRLEEVAKQQRQMIERQQQTDQQAQQQQVMQQLASRVRSAEVAFAQSNPDYQEAINHLSRARAQELAVFGLPPETIAERVGQEQANLALQWAHQGMNPAQVAYELAKARGYQPKAQQQAQQPSAEERIAQQQRGTSAARGLGNGGGANKGKLTAEALANMSDEEFAQLSDSDFRKAMGG